MDKKNTFEVTLSMMPDTITKLSYANFFHLDDNFEHTWHRASYDGETVKLMFATLSSIHLPNTPLTRKVK